MIQPEDLIEYRDSSSDEEADRLEQRLALIVQEQKGLSRELFDAIARWKLRTQYNRTARHWNNATYQALEDITHLALRDYPNIPDNELFELRTNLLMSLPGVGLGLASAILGLAYPNMYCVIDFRGWRRVFPEHFKSVRSFQSHNGTTQLTFTIGEYWRYVVAVRQIALSLGWSARKTDTAIWAYDEQATR